MQLLFLHVLYLGVFRRHIEIETESKNKHFLMYACNAGPPMAIPIYRVLPYCVIIMQLTATKSIHIIVQELMNLLHRNKFSPWEDFFFNPFGSDVISSNQLCKCTCMYISTGAGQSICSGKMKRLKYNCFVY